MADNSLQAAIDWEYFASAGAHTFTKGVSKQIRAGGAGDLYLIDPATGNERLFAADVAAGEKFNVQVGGIGASTTCDKLTVLFNTKA